MKLFKTSLTTVLLGILLFSLIPTAAAIPLHAAIRYNQTISGHLADGGRQTYTFSGSQGDVITITLISSGLFWDPYLELRDANGVLLAENDDIDFYNLNWDSVIANLTLPATGTYTIVVRSYDEILGGSFNLTLTAVALAAPTVANSPIGVSVQARTSVRIRSTSSTSGARLGSIPAGTVVPVLAVDGNWVQINYNGIVGWSSLDYLDVVSGTLPNTTTVTTPAQTAPASNIVRSIAEVHIRAEANREAASLAVAPYNATATLLATSGEWYQVNYNGVVGWTFASYWRQE